MGCPTDQIGQHCFTLTLGATPGLSRGKGWKQRWNRSTALARSDETRMVWPCASGILQRTNEGSSSLGWGLVSCVEKVCNSRAILVKTRQLCLRQPLDLEMVHLPLRHKHPLPRPQLQRKMCNHLLCPRQRRQCHQAPRLC